MPTIACVEEDLSREAIVLHLQRGLEREPAVLAMWLEGSFATVRGTFIGLRPVTSEFSCPSRTLGRPLRSPRRSERAPPCEVRWPARTSPRVEWFPLRDASADAFALRRDGQAAEDRLGDFLRTSYARGGARVAAVGARAGQ